MTSDPSNYHREYSPYGSYSILQFEGSDVISVLKNLIVCSLSVYSWQLLFIITLLISYCSDKQNAFRNFSHMLLHSPL